MTLSDHPITGTCSILSEGTRDELLAHLTGENGVAIAITTERVSETYSLLRSDDRQGIRYLLHKWDDKGTTYTVRPPQRGYRTRAVCDCPHFTYRCAAMVNDDGTPAECKHCDAVRTIVTHLYKKDAALCVPSTSPSA